MMRDERPLRDVPGGLLALLAALLAAQLGLQAAAPRPVARADELRDPPPAWVLRVAAAGEPNVLGPLTALRLQAFDNQPGLSIPFRDLDYARVAAWLRAILAADPAGQYPMMMATHVYSQVPDDARVRVMLELVHEQFLQDPARRWRWMADAVIAAKHRLHDNTLALAWARDITRLAPGAPDWARQMQIFILEDMGEVESARIMLGGLVVGGQITDPQEIHFLTERLKQMENDEKSAAAAKTRQ